MRNPGGPRPAAGKQITYRHQLEYLARYWRILTDDQKAAYDAQGEDVTMTGYDLFIQEHYPDGKLNFLPIADTSVCDDGQNLNIDNPHWIFTYDSTTRISRAFFDFAINKLSPFSSVINKLSPFSSVTKAEICLYYVTDACYWLAPHLINVYKITEAWNEATMTWGNQPSRAGTPSTNFTVQADNTWHNIDVTTDVNNFLSSGTPFYGWCLEGPRPGAGHEHCMYFRSKETFHNNKWPYVKISL
jgi:hypothetical protein